MQRFVEGRDPERFLAPLRAHLKGLQIERVIQFPTQVLQTNGSLSEDGRTVTWRFTAKQLGKKPPTLEVTFRPHPDMDLESFDDNPFSENERGLRRRFTTPPPGSTTR